MVDFLRKSEDAPISRESFKRMGNAPQPVLSPPAGVSPLACLCLAALGTQARNVPLSAIVQRVQAVIPPLDSLRLTRRVLEGLEQLRDAELVEVLPCNRPPPCFTISVNAWSFFRDLEISFPLSPAASPAPMAPFQGLGYFDNLLDLEPALSVWRWQFWRLMFRHADYFMNLPEAVQDSSEWSGFKAAYTAWRTQLDEQLTSPAGDRLPKDIF